MRQAYATLCIFLPLVFLHGQVHAQNPTYSVDCGGNAPGFIPDSAQTINIIGNTAIAPANPATFITGASAKLAPALKSHRWSKSAASWGFKITGLKTGKYDCKLIFFKPVKGDPFISAITCANTGDIPLVNGAPESSWKCGGKPPLPSVELSSPININVGGNQVFAPFQNDQKSWIWGPTDVTAEAPQVIVGAKVKDQRALKSHRWGKQKAPWGMKIPFKTGKYQCSLHFAETSPNYFGVGKRVFDVNFDGYKRRVDVFAKVGKFASYVETFKCVTAFPKKNGNTVLIEFAPVKGDAFLSAITCIKTGDLPLVFGSPASSWSCDANTGGIGPIEPSKPSGELNVNVGGFKIGDRFIADNPAWVWGPTGVSQPNPKPFILGAEPKNTQALSTHRWGKAGAPWGYNIPVANKGKHDCSLHFAETSPYYFGVNKRVFQVTVMGITRSNIDVFGNAGGAKKSYVETFKNLPIQDVLRIYFKPVKGDAFLSAITCVRTGTL